MHEKSIDLINLIKSLTSAEKGYFKKFKKTEEKDSKVLVLFDLCLSLKSKTSEFIEQKSIETFTRKGYLSLKKELFQAICDVMCYYHRNDLRSVKYYQKMQKINFLIDKNLHKEAAKYSYILRKQLYDRHVQNLIPTLYAIEGYVHFMNNNINSFCELINEHFRVNDIIDEYKEKNDTLMHLFASLLLKDSKDKMSEENLSSLKKLTTYYQRKYPGSNNFKSKVAEVDHLNSLFFNLTNTEEERLEIAIKMHDVVKKSPSFFNRDSLLSVYNDLITIAVRINKKEVVSFYLKEYEKCEVKSIYEQKLKKGGIELLKFKIAAIENDFEGIEKLIKNFSEQKDCLPFKYSKLFETEIIQYQLFANIITSNVIENKKIILKYATSSLKKNKIELFEVYRVIEVLTMIELEDFDGVIYKIRNAKLSFKKKTDLLELLTVIEKVYHRMEILEFDGSDDVVVECEKIYDKYYQKEKAHMVYANFDLTGWVKKCLIRS